MYTKKLICQSYQISYPTLQKRLKGTYLHNKRSLLTAEDVQFIIGILGSPKKIELE